MTENLIKYMHHSCYLGPNMNNAQGATVKYKIFNLSNLTCISLGRKKQGGYIFIYLFLYRIVDHYGRDA